MDELKDGTKVLTIQDFKEIGSLSIYDLLKNLERLNPLSKEETFDTNHLFFDLCLLEITKRVFEDQFSPIEKVTVKSIIQSYETRMIYFGYRLPSVGERQH